MRSPGLPKQQPFSVTQYYQFALYALNRPSLLDDNTTPLKNAPAK